MQLTSHNSTHPTHLTPSPHPTRLAQFNSLNTPHSAHLTQVVSHNSSDTTQLTQLISLHSNHSADLTQLALLNSWNWGARGDSLRNTRCCTFIIIWSYLRTNFNPTSHLPQLISYTHRHSSLHTSRLTILRSWQTSFPCGAIRSFIFFLQWSSYSNDHSEKKTTAIQPWLAAIYQPKLVDQN